MNDQPITCTNNIDEEGMPAGGGVSGIGLAIEWQRGPLGRGKDRKEPNGAFVETVLRAARQRLEWHQEDPRFACDYNGWAINCIDEALKHLGRRTRDREIRGVEGTHEP